MFQTSTFNNPDVVPTRVRKKYEFLETSSASAVLKAVCPEEWEEIISVLDEFSLDPNNWLVKGGNRGDIAKIIDGMFYERGWRETRIDLETRGVLLTDFAGSKESSEARSRNELPFNVQTGYRVDNHKGQVVVDVEWNAKDGNLDRDLAAYRAWYEAGVISGAVIITKDRLPLLKLANEIWNKYQEGLPVGKRQEKRKLPIDLETSTTTSLDKAEMRVLRGVGGTCPVLVVAVSALTWNQQPFKGESAIPTEVESQGLAITEPTN